MRNLPFLLALLVPLLLLASMTQGRFTLALLGRKKARLPAPLKPIIPKIQRANAKQLSYINPKIRRKPPFFTYNPEASPRELRKWAQDMMIAMRRMQDPDDLQPVKGKQTVSQATLQKFHKRVTNNAANIRFTNRATYPFHIGSRVYGEGSFGQVREGTWHPYPSYPREYLKVAIKIMPKIDVYDNGEAYSTWPYFQKEIYASLQAYAVDPDRVVRIYDVYLHHPTHWIIIMEPALCDVSSLLRRVDMVRAWDPGYEADMPLPEAVIRDIYLPIIRTYAMLNKDKRLIHQDAKPENLLCFRPSPSRNHPHPFPCYAKISDFGLSHLRGDDWPDGVDGTPRYLPRVVLHHDFRRSLLTTKFRETVDVYGVIASIHELRFPKTDDQLLPDDKGYVARGWDPKEISPELDRLFYHVLTPKEWENKPRTFIQLIPLLKAWGNLEISRSQ
ncbi:MAG: kinase-like domain-containing protein [Piptocephalis tieghemiana]|nr:MAG: kinase-like domain-containing protein [Piptocephalis tieghemiana]